MKKYAFILAAICACMVLSCTKETPKFEEDHAAPAMRTVTITASIDDVLTKTSYAGGTTFSWTKGDKISVMCSDGEFRTFTADKTASASTFTGEVPEGVTLGDYALFPADANHVYSGLKYNLPEYKDLTQHPSSDLPMVGDKNEDDSYSFMHCTGAALFTLDNIPSNIVSVKVTFVSASLKLSGLFGVFKSSEQWRWNADAGSTDSEKTFSRRVNVVNGKAEVYLPYAWGAQMWANNTVSVTGYDSSDNEYSLVAGKTMKGTSSYTYVRAHIQPLKPLVLSNLNSIDWTAEDVATSILDASDSRKCLTELKATADSYFMYVRVKGPAVEFVGDYLDIYLSDGNGEHYALADDNKYWSTGGETLYNREHKGPITTNSLAMTFNDKSIETKTDNNGTDIYWYMAFPRSAHSLISTYGTVYIGFILWNGWGVTGVIPTKHSQMLPVSLP